MCLRNLRLSIAARSRQGHHRLPQRRDEPELERQTDLGPRQGAIFSQGHFLYLSLSICMYVYIYIYIYRERERERERDLLLSSLSCSCTERA